MLSNVLDRLFKLNMMMVDIKNTFNVTIGL